MWTKFIGMFVLLVITLVWWTWMIDNVGAKTEGLIWAILLAGLFWLVQRFSQTKWAVFALGVFGVLALVVVAYFVGADMIGTSDVYKSIMSIVFAVWLLILSWLATKDWKSMSVPVVPYTITRRGGSNGEPVEGQVV